VTRLYGQQGKLLIPKGRRMGKDYLTVLASDNDPLRQDTPAKHELGRWLVDRMGELGVTGQRHLRGLHYLLIGATKPDGTPYANNDDNWKWLGKVAKAARWLGYMEFDQIVDERNDEPVRRDYTGSTLHTKQFNADYPEPYGSVTVAGYPVDDVSVDYLLPAPSLEFEHVQPYRIVLIGEKSSLRPILDPIAQRYRADLYLPTGEISDTQIHRMASDGAADGRPMVVLYFADADPSGWQMGISVARKLQAFKMLEFQDLDVELRRVALTPDQVLPGGLTPNGLPSTPLKPTEDRAEDWVKAFGVEQTEIDALAATAPGALRRLAVEAIAPFFDPDLEERADALIQEWEAQALQAMGNQDGLREWLGQMLDDASRIVLPEAPEMPEPELTGDRVHPLMDTRRDYVNQCLILKASKKYDAGWDDYDDWDNDDDE
jgi:hypothetical protein